MTTSRGISCIRFLCTPCTRLAFCHTRCCPRQVFVALCCPLSTILQWSWTCDVRNSTFLVDHLWCCVSWLLLLQCVNLLALILIELFFSVSPTTTTSSPCSWFTCKNRRVQDLSTSLWNRLWRCELHFRLCPVPALDTSAISVLLEHNNEWWLPLGMQNGDRMDWICWRSLWSARSVLVPSQVIT